MKYTFEIEDWKLTTKTAFKTLDKIYQITIIIVIIYCDFGSLPRLLLVDACCSLSPTYNRLFPICDNCAVLSISEKSFPVVLALSIANANNSFLAFLALMHLSAYTLLSGSFQLHPFSIFSVSPNVPSCTPLPIFYVRLLLFAS